MTGTTAMAKTAVALIDCGGGGRPSGNTRKETAARERRLQNAGARIPERVGAQEGKRRGGLEADNNLPG